MIEHLAKDIFDSIQHKAQNVKDMSESQLRAVLESAVRRLDLVSREEFEAQQAVLLRTREKLEQLEAKFDALAEEPKSQ